MAANPREVLTETHDGWTVNGVRVPGPFEWLLSADQRFEFVCGALSFEAAWMLDTIHTPPRNFSPRIWAAGYDKVRVITQHAESSGDTAHRATHLRMPMSDGYIKDVERCISEIYAGELFEINYTGSFDGTWHYDGLTLYEQLRVSSTGNYFAYIDAGDVEIVSVSPEQFLCIEGGRVFTRPIKGTRPRGETPERDAVLARELKESIKDRAENMMIVDLMRNDLTRVCAPGSVAVRSLCDVETFAGLHHLVSTIEGRLAESVSPMEAFLACFPAGSITGAPKLRAIELIAEIETRPRGFYTGSIFRIHNGSFDSSVLIRTIEKRANEIRYGAGGAVVADSDPVGEWQEALTKAHGFLRLFE